jgi:hypothetical protein
MIRQTRKLANLIHFNPHRKVVQVKPKYFVRPAQVQKFAQPYVKSETKVIWSSKLPLRKTFAGVYVWILNLHNINTVLYIGQSGDVRKRLMAHYSNSGKPTRVCVYWDKLNESRFIPCNQYNISCDCLPRFYVEIVINPSEGLLECEKMLTKVLNPILLNDDIVDENDQPRQLEAD